MSFFGVDTDELRSAGQKCQEGAETTDQVIQYLRALVIALRAASFFTGGASAAYAEYLTSTVIPWLERVSAALKLFANVLLSHAKAQDDASDGKSVDWASLPTYSTPALPTSNTSDYPAIVAPSVGATAPAPDAGPNGDSGVAPVAGGNAPAGVAPVTGIGGGVGGIGGPEGGSPSGGTGGVTGGVTPGGWNSGTPGGTTPMGSPAIGGPAPLGGADSGFSPTSGAAIGTPGGGGFGGGGGIPVGEGADGSGSGTPESRTFGSGGGIGGTGGGTPMTDTQPVSVSENGAGGGFGAAAAIAGAAAVLGMGGAALAKRNGRKGAGELEELVAGNGLGSRGEDVKALQEQLTAAGYDTRSTDGHWDANTQAAYEAWRSDNPLEVRHGTGYTSPDGFDYASVVGVADNPQVTPEFCRELEGVAQRLGARPEDLMAVMAEQSAFSPAAQDPATNATGLIGFRPETAAALGTSTDELSRMSAVEQLPWVEALLSERRGHIGDLESLQTSIRHGSNQAELVGSVRSTTHG